MAPTGVMSSTGTVHSLSATPSCSSKIWHPKRLAGPSGLRRSPSHGSMDKACLRSSVSLKAVEYVYGRPRRSRIEQGGKRPSSRHLLVAAVEGSFAVEEASSLPADMTPEVSEEENAIDVPATPVPEGGSTLVEAVRASPRAERFKPRVPGQKARREDPEVPNEALVPGATFTGTVTTIQPFGAFVNFGAFTDGLVHISKLSKGYVSKISDFVKLGQQVKVTILNVEETSGRIALTMVEKENGEAREAATKTGEPREGGERSPSRFQQGPDGRPINRGRIAGGGRQSNKRDEAKKPPTKLVKGQEVEGTVKNKIRSGVFVDLPENEEAFLRFSDIPGGDNMYQESTLQIGEKIKATVLKIDRGKISLTQKPVVDILSVNRSINKGDDIGAANPFEIAFRAFNMIPKVQDDVDQEDKTVAEVDESEEISAQQTASETSSKDEEDEEVIAPKATALIPDEAATEYDASVDAATEGDPPAKLATSDESPVEAATEVESSDIASVEDVVSEATDAALKLEEVNTPAASSTDEIIAPEIAGPAEAAEAVEEAIPDANAAANEISSAVDEILSEAKVDEESPSTSEDIIPEIAGPAEAAQAVKEILPETSAAVDEISSAVEEILPEKIADEENRDAGNGIVEESSLEADAAKQQPPAQIPNVDAVNPPPSILEEVSGTEANPEVNAMLSEGGPALEEGNPSSLPVVEGALSTESIAKEASANGTLVELSSSPVSSIDEGLESAAASNPEASVTGVVEKEAAPQVENSVEVAKPKAGPSAATVKQLREETGAGMMDCKRALLDTAGDIEKARDYLRKKGLASADKKASRIAAEGLVGSYVHDSRVGVLVEVNCETDFVARGPAFKSLVQDVGMQVVASGQVQFVSVDDVSSEFVNKEKELEFQRDDLASKPEAIRAKIVEGRVSKRISELALLEQPYIRDDKIAVKDLVKQTVATLGENIKIRRFERYVLGEGLAKKGTDFAAEVAAQTAAASTKKADPSPASESSSPSKPAEPANTVAVSASLVKELRDQTGAGMMDCKKALAATENDLEKATDYLRKKGLAGAEKKAGRVAAEGLIGTYVHDGRIGVMIEVNCETDFVARGQTFKDLVQDMAMQVAAYPQVQFVNLSDIPAELVSKEKEIESGKEDLASKPEAIRAKIVDGRVTKRLSELALVEQAYIRDDKKAVKDVVKEAIASLGENIQVRRFVRFNLGEGLAKKVVDFASEVAAQSGVPAT